jgi:hypothetical protein
MNPTEQSQIKMETNIKPPVPCQDLLAKEHVKTIQLDSTKSTH